MSAVSIEVLEGLNQQARAAQPAENPQDANYALHVALIRQLQGHARGVPRQRRSRLHQQFAREWRDFMETGGPLSTADYPLLGILNSQHSGAGELLLY